ncbi:hypothetical protein BDQ17DRAFT_1336683 [Cyathus striatus]|nr:hypothetical protein BDQ17DRAFT_1336683 [Cyathus striatus]
MVNQARDTRTTGDRIKTKAENDVENLPEKQYGAKILKGFIRAPVEVVGVIFRSKTRRLSLEVNLECWVSARRGLKVWIQAVDYPPRHVGLQLHHLFPLVDFEGNVTLLIKPPGLHVLAKISICDVPRGEASRTPEARCCKDGDAFEFDRKLHLNPPRTKPSMPPLVSLL